ncbi:aa3-type cytochrome c oxidase subunit IV [Sphingomonas ginkgonis]|uniref:Aa3-type cytochrome c oxidase subunit IV n=1 Tax=Sphingomonas ginkgonis TaxID=2315330 RepID=A0A3R9WSK8_9SPHN|nr:aa3-type cytochrome c oxidase subunit IV [Sphingomonas ginkgonis]RST30783.1 aa3-type cytochrome c oxidase subunit IV [Sphingomonas ginkgonis]
MAADTHSSTTEPASSDMKAHVRNYEGFTKVVKYGAIIVFVIAMAVVFIIAN